MASTLELTVDSFSEDVRDRRGLLTDASVSFAPMLINTSQWTYLQPLIAKKAKYWRKARIATSTTEFTQTQHVWILFNKKKVDPKQPLLFTWFRNVHERRDSTVYVQEYIDQLFIWLFNDGADDEVNTTNLQALIEEIPGDRRRKAEAEKRRDNRQMGFDSDSSTASSETENSDENPEFMREEKELLGVYLKEYNKRIKDPVTTTEQKKKNDKDEPERTFPRNLLGNICYLTDVIRQEARMNEEKYLESFLGYTKGEFTLVEKPIFTSELTLKEYAFVFPPDVSVALNTTQELTIQNSDDLFAGWEGSDGTAYWISWHPQGTEKSLQKKIVEQSSYKLFSSIENFFGHYQKDNVSLVSLEFAEGRLHVHVKNYSVNEYEVTSVFEVEFNRQGPTLISDNTVKANIVQHIGDVRRYKLQYRVRNDGSLASMAAFVADAITSTEENYGIFTKNMLTPRTAELMGLRVFKDRKLVQKNIVAIETPAPLSVHFSYEWPDNDDGFLERVFSLLSKPRIISRILISDNNVQGPSYDEIYEQVRFSPFKTRQGLAVEVLGNNAVFTAKEMGIRTKATTTVRFMPLVLRDGRLRYQIVDTDGLPFSSNSYFQKTGSGEMSDKFGVLSDEFENDKTVTKLSEVIVVKKKVGVRSQTFFMYHSGAEWIEISHESRQLRDNTLVFRFGGRTTVKKLKLTVSLKSVGDTQEALRVYLQENEPDIYGKEMRTVAIQDMTRRETIMCIKSWMWTVLFAEESYAKRQLVYNAQKKKIIKEDIKKSSNSALAVLQGELAYLPQSSATKTYNDDLDDLNELLEKQRFAHSQLWLQTNAATTVHMTTSGNDVAVWFYDDKRQYSRSLSLPGLNKELVWNTCKLVVSRLFPEHNPTEAPKGACLFVQNRAVEEYRLSQNVAVWYSNTLKFNLKMVELNRVSCLRCEAFLKGQNFTSCPYCPDFVHPEVQMSSDEVAEASKFNDATKYVPNRKKPGRMRKFR